jgi:TolA-binding protein
MKRRSWLLSAFVVLVLAALLVPAPTAALEEADRLYLVGEQGINDGLYALAARVLERFVTDFPGDSRVPAATLLLGRAWLGVGLSERALETFRKVQQVSPPPGRPLEARLWEAEALFRLKRYPDARTIFDDILRTDAASPVAPDAMYGLAWTELEMRRPEAAAKAFRDFLTTWPDHALVPSATLFLARTLIDLKRPAEALPLLSDFTTKYPNDALRPDAQYLLGLARVRGGDPRAGVADLKAFLEANPKHDLAPSARRLVNETSVRGGDTTARGGDTAPRGGDKPARGADTSARASKDDLQAAYEERLAETPPTADGLYEAATIAGRLGRTKDQEALWRRVRTTFPEHAMGRRASLDLATAAFKRKEWKEASTLARAAAQSEEDLVRSEALLLAGESELKLKRYPEAVKVFEGARNVEGADAAVRYRAMAGLGLAHEELKQWKPALTAYEAVASKSPDLALRDWAQERAKAVKTKMPAGEKSSGSKPAPEKPSNGKPANKKTDSRS